MEHGGGLVNPSVDDPEIVDFGEQVLVNQVQTSLLWRRALFVTILDETGICFLTCCLQGFAEGVVVLVNV